MTGDSFVPLGSGAACTARRASPSCGRVALSSRYAQARAAAGAVQRRPAAFMTLSAPVRRPAQVSGEMRAGG